MDFPSTDWSQLAQATLHGDARAQRALESFYLGYRAPVRMIMRKRGVPEGRLDDLCQDFFLKVMDQSFLRRADPARGRFRVFVSTLLRCFLADEADQRLAQKRGGGAQSLSLDAEDGLAESLPADEMANDLALDREWALHLVEKALDRVAVEWTRGRETKSERFAVMRAFLPGAAVPGDPAAAAGKLGMSDTAFRSELSRLRASFRSAILAEVSQTVSDPAEAAEEMQHLAAVLQDCGANSLPQAPSAFRTGN